MIRFHGPRKSAKGTTRRRIPGVMNKTEAQFEREVLMPLAKSGEIIWHGFEAMTFKLAKGSNYTPDFIVQFLHGDLVAYEVKGAKKDGKALCEEASLVRIKNAAEKFPIQFVMTWPGKHGWEERTF